MKKIITVVASLFLLINFSFAQNFTHADTLRGSNGVGRSWWNATKYNLHVTFNLPDSSINGFNIISYKELTKKHPDFFQIDLQEPLILDSIFLENGTSNFPLEKTKLSFTREGHAWFVSICIFTCACT